MAGWSRSDNKANSVQLLLQLPTGTELGKNTHRQLQLAQAALRAPPEVALQCVAGHGYYQYFGITRRYMQFFLYTYFLQKS